MKSKGGLREYSCPECGSINIGRGPKESTFFMVRFNGHCRDCRSFWDWNLRVGKRSTMFLVLTKRKRYSGPVAKQNVNDIK